MDQSNKVHDREPERDTECDSHTGAVIVLTATLAIAGIGVFAAPSEASTVAERINAIHIAVESGVMKPLYISPSGDASPQGRMMAYDKIGDDKEKKGK